MKFACAPETRPLPGYTVKRAIDRGAFGEVYYGVTDGGKEVALKLLHENPQSELRGVSQCLNLKHPNLVSLFDIKSDEQGDWWVVMEYIHGPSLEQRLTETPRGLPLAEVGEWLRGLCAGIDFLHSQKIVHRDVKPGNVFREGSTVKIGDVGLAKIMAASRRSAQTESVGTVYYMAPEVAHGRYGREVDIYSLGVMLYEMLTGQLPFDGESTGEILMKHLTQPPDLARVPTRLRPVLAHALEKDPAKRTASAGGLLKEFEEAIREPRAEEVTPPPVPPTTTPERQRQKDPCRPDFPTGPRCGYQPFREWKRAANRPPIPEKPTALMGRDETLRPLVPPWLLWTILGVLAGLTWIQPIPFRTKLSELFLLGCIAAVWKITSWWSLPASEQPPVMRRLGRSMRDWMALSFVPLFFRNTLALAAVFYLWMRASGGNAMMPALMDAIPLALLATVFMRIASRYTAPLAAQNIEPPPPVLPPATEPEPLAQVVTRQVPPPIPVAAPASGESKIDAHSEAPSPRVGDLFLSAAKAGVLVPLATLGLFFGLPESDRTWQPMQRDELMYFFGASSLVAVWGILAGSWYLNSSSAGSQRPRVVLVLLGLAVGTLIAQWHTWLDIELPFSSVSPAMFSRVGSHPLWGFDQPSTLGFAVFFGMLFGARSWWNLFEPGRSPRFDIWQVLWGAILAGMLIPIVITFPKVWGGLWGALLGLVLPLCAGWASSKTLNTPPKHARESWFVH